MGGQEIQSTPLVNMSPSERGQGLPGLNHDVAVSSKTSSEDKDLEHSLDRAANIGLSAADIQEQGPLRLTVHRWQFHT